MTNIKNYFAIKARSAGVIAIALVGMGLPGLAYAATYAYVNTAGEVRTVEAPSAATAIVTAPSIATHSGVLLLMGSVAPTTGFSSTITNVVVNPTSNSASVNWNTNPPAKGVVYYSTSPLTTYERPNAVDVSGTVAMTDTNLNTSQSVVLSGLTPNTTYYYLIYTTDQAGFVSVTFPTSFRTTN